MKPSAYESLLTPSEVAKMFRVDPKTVTRWAKAGKLASVKTLGGHRRYPEAAVRALLHAAPEQARPDDPADTVRTSADDQADRAAEACHREYYDRRQR